MYLEPLEILFFLVVALIIGCRFGIWMLYYRCKAYYLEAESARKELVALKNQQIVPAYTALPTIRELGSYWEILQGTLERGAVLRDFQLAAAPADAPSHPLMGNRWPSDDGWQYSYMGDGLWVKYHLKATPDESAATIASLCPTAPN